MPEVNGAVATGRSQHEAIRAEPGIEDRIPVSCECMEQRSIPVPKLDGTVVTGRHIHLTVRADSNALNHTVVAFEAVEFPHPIYGFL
jgi:hypothetical protein